jgi:hypothetical protein
MKIKILDKKILQYPHLKFIIFVFLFTTLSGALRKWVISASAISNAVLGVQIIIPFFFFFLKGATKYTYQQRNIILALMVYLVMLSLMAANPSNYTIFHGIIGFLLHGGFWVAIFTYLRLRKEISIEVLIPLFILVCVGETILGSIQSQLPGDAFINRYAVSEGDGAADAYVGDSVRVTGTFSYVSGYSAFLFFYTFLVCALIKIKYPIPIVITVFFMGLYGCLISGSRGSFLVYLVTIGIFIGTSINFKENYRLIFGSITSLLVFGLLNFASGDPLNILDTFGSSVENFEERSDASQEPWSDRAFEAIGQLSNYNGPSPVVGVGLGATYQGANALFGFNPLLFNVGWEGEAKRIVIEGGWTLLLMRFILLYYLVAKLKFNWIFKSYVVFLLVFAASIVFNTYSSFYFLLGIMLLDKVCSLDKPELD